MMIIMYPEHAPKYLNGPSAFAKERLGVYFDGAMATYAQVAMRSSEDVLDEDEHMLRVAGWQPPVAEPKPSNAEQTVNERLMILGAIEDSLSIGDKDKASWPLREIAITLVGHVRYMLFADKQRYESDCPLSFGELVGLAHLVMQEEHEWLAEEAGQPRSMQVLADLRVGKSLAISMYDEIATTLSEENSRGN